jgi:hypothetical protein
MYGQAWIARTGQDEQDSLFMMTGRGQDGQDRTSRTGQDSQNMTVRTGELGTSVRDMMAKTA